MYFPEGMTWKTPRIGEANGNTYYSNSATEIVAGEWIDVVFDLSGLYTTITTNGLTTNPILYFRTMSGANIADGSSFNTVYVSTYTWCDSLPQ